jgi:ribosomal protein S18 acetylase RimI-like enzyme
MRTPWDSRALGMDTYEILALSKDALEEMASLTGHFTLRVDPQFPRKIIYSESFYYCDTLVEPYCESSHFIHFKNEKASLSGNIPLENLLAISHGAFYGRFHRDFNIPKRLADLRYDMWLQDLYSKGSIFGLMFENDLAGFLGFSGNKMCLHAVHKKYRGHGLAKYLWGAACTELYKRGQKELISSISVSNLPALNLYSSLGFRFRKSLDVYHKLI